MNRVVLLILILFSTNLSLYSQTFTGSWIKTKVTYPNGTAIEDDFQVKYSYTRYRFSKSGKVGVYSSFDQIGDELDFNMNNNVMQFKNQAGFIVNEFMIEKVGSNDLVLRQKGRTGFNDEDCLIYHFIKEEKYKEFFVPSNDDFILLANGDTTYIANQFLYPAYKGEKSFFIEHIKGVSDQGSRDTYFEATFIVNKNGEADSLKIIEGSDKNFNNQVLKNFKKLKKNWQPALFQGRPVSVQMKLIHRTSSSYFLLPAREQTLKANEAYRAKNYSKALFYYDKAIESIPFDVENLYKRAVCRFKSGQTKGACADLFSIKKLGDKSADELLRKWCN